MSILDEIARRRRASALRRLGPPPAGPEARQLMPARRVPASPELPTAEERAPTATVAHASVPAARVSSVAGPESAHTLESALPQALASIAMAQREPWPPANRVPRLEPEAWVEPVEDPEPEPALLESPGPEPEDPAEPALADPELADPELADPELADPEPEGQGPARAENPQAPPLPPARAWTQSTRSWVATPQADVPAPLETGSRTGTAPTTEAAPQEAPRHDTWLPQPAPRPDLFKLTGTDPVTGQPEPVGVTGLEPVTPSAAPAVTSTDLVPASWLGTQALTVPEAHPETKPPSFVERTQLRRRIRFLRQLREVQLRDLGGFVLELHRFGREKPELTRSKLEAAAETDRELRQLEYALSGRVELRVVREAGIGGACSQCGAVYGTEDRFCSNCGEALPGTALLRDDRPSRADRPSGPDRTAR